MCVASCVCTQKSGRQVPAEKWRSLPRGLDSSLGMNGRAERRFGEEPRLCRDPSSHLYPNFVKSHPCNATLGVGVREKKTM